jgi:hypothetical protein
MKLERGKILRLEALLRKNQFQLITGSKFYFNPGLGADADPVNTGRRQEGAVGLNSHLEAEMVKSGD